MEAQELPATSSGLPSGKGIKNSPGESALLDDPSTGIPQKERTQGGGQLYGSISDSMT